MRGNPSQGWINQLQVNDCSQGVSKAGSFFHAKNRRLYEEIEKADFDIVVGFDDLADDAADHCICSNLDSLTNLFIGQNRLLYCNTIGNLIMYIFNKKDIL